MVILAVDPNPDDLELLSRCLKKAYPESRIVPFSDPLAACQYGVTHPAHALYTSCAMERLSGPELARMLRRGHPELEVTLVSEEADAGSTEAGAQIQKPVSVYQILAANDRDIPVQRLMEKTAASRHNRPVRRVY